MDGEGTLVVTEQCLLSPGRTASAVLAEEVEEDTIWPVYAKRFEPWSEELRAYMDEYLKAYLGVEKVIWIKEGIDPEETNGHIDDVATFIAPGVMACIWTDDEDYPFYEASATPPTRRCRQRHRREGPRQLKVYKLPMPAKPLYMDQASCDTIDMDENAEPRVADEPLIASYMNYLVPTAASSCRSTATRTIRWPWTRCSRSTTRCGARASTSAWASSPTRSSSAAATSTASPSRSPRPKRVAHMRLSSPLDAPGSASRAFCASHQVAGKVGLLEEKKGLDYEKKSSSCIVLRQLMFKSAGICGLFRREHDGRSIGQCA